jgi:hypothetical protein
VGFRVNRFTQSTEHPVIFVGYSSITGIVEG